MFDTQKKQLFDGKIGTWPFITKEPAQRNSKNRKRGTMITKPGVLVNKDVVQDMVVNNMIPTIKEKWPKFDGVDRKKIVLQQDNAKPHCKVDDPGLVDALTYDGWKIQLGYEPPIRLI